jgi:hypothetical protein
MAAPKLCKRNGLHCDIKPRKQFREIQETSENSLFWFSFFIELFRVYIWLLEIFYKNIRTIEIIFRIFDYWKIYIEQLGNIHTWEISNMPVQIRPYTSDFAVSQFAAGNQATVDPNIRCSCYPLELKSTDSLRVFHKLVMNKSSLYFWTKFVYVLAIVKRWDHVCSCARNQCRSGESPSHHMLGTDSFPNLGMHAVTDYLQNNFCML